MTPSKNGATASETIEKQAFLPMECSKNRGWQAATKAAHPIENLEKSFAARRLARFAARRLARFEATVSTSGVRAQLRERDLGPVGAWSTTAQWVAVAAAA